MCLFYIFTWIWLLFIHIFGLGSLSITRHSLLHSITGHHETAFQIFWTISELKCFCWFSFFWLIKHRIVLGDMFSVSYETYIDTHFVSYLWTFFCKYIPSFHWFKNHLIWFNNCLIGLFIRNIKSEFSNDVLHVILAYLY